MNAGVRNALLPFLKGGLSWGFVQHAARQRNGGPMQGDTRPARREGFSVVNKRRPHTSLNPMLIQLLPERIAIQPEQFGRARLIAFGVMQYHFQ